MSAEALHMHGTAVDSFTLFVKEFDPGLKHALVAAFGQELGLEATAEAWAFAWENWDRVRIMNNPAGYVWGVGRNKARAARRRQGRLFPPVPDEIEHLVEPWVEDLLLRTSLRG